MARKRQERLIHTMSRICNRVEEEHVRISEVHRDVQEQKMLESSQYDIEAPCVWPWCVLWFAAPIKKNENIRSAGAARVRMDKTINHALRLAMASLFASKWNPRDYPVS